MRFIAPLLALILTTACAQAEPPEIAFSIENRLPHAADHFTQGLLFYQGQLYESTGQYGQSRLIRYAEDHSTPRIQRNLEPRYFGEGIAILDQRLYLLTWKAGLAQIYDPSGFSLLGSFNYSGEGWGLTSDDKSLWMSNGSAELLQLDADGEMLGRLAVHLDGRPLDRLNELEYVEGWILANRWYDTRIYLIDSDSGAVAATLDLTEIAAPELASHPDKVLNGIAWHPERRTLWVTGKHWSQLYELQLELPSRAAGALPMDEPPG